MSYALMFLAKMDAQGVENTLMVYVNGFQVIQVVIVQLNAELTVQHAVVVLALLVQGQI